MYQNPYPCVWVRVLTGTGTGCPEKPQGSPCHSLAVPLARIFINSESGMELAICCLAIASPCFHSFNSFFHSRSNCFSSSENSSLVLTDVDIGSLGSIPVPSIWESIPRASRDQAKWSL